MKDFTAIPAGMVEGEYETQKVDGKRQDPNQWHGNDFFAELIGGGHQKRGSTGSQETPKDICERRDYIGCCGWRGFRGAPEFSPRRIMVCVPCAPCTTGAE